MTGWRHDQLVMVVQLAKAYGVRSDVREQFKILNKTVAQPRPGREYGKREFGVFYGRGDELTVLLKHNDFENILNMASLKLTHIAKKRWMDDPRPDDEKPLEYSDKWSTPEEAALRKLLDHRHTMRARSEREYRTEPYSKMAAHAIHSDYVGMKGRVAARKASTRNFAGINRHKTCLRRTHGHSMERPEPRAVYVPHPDRLPYEIPQPELTIGTKIRPSLVRSVDFAWARLEFVKKHLRENRRDPESRAAAKKMIRRSLQMMLDCYEIEVVGITPSGLGVDMTGFNQCYIGGGNSGRIVYNASLLFRSASTDHLGKVNQIFVVYVDCPVSLHTLLHYVMRVEEKPLTVEATAV